MPEPEFGLKAISPEAVDAAIQKMERYRLLNEPEEAESICRDVLHVAPDHHEARIGLLLCLSDQFGRSLARAWPEAQELLESLPDPYERAYYDGILCERRAKAHHAGGSPQAGGLAHSWLVKAMRRYELAEKLRPAGNDSARLRWNSCARMIMQHAEIKQSEPESYSPELLE